MNFGILTVSDRCFKGEAEDISSTCLKESISNTFKNSKFVQKVVPDEIEQIKSTLIAWCDSGCDIIFTTGGTGFAPRDVTPEATKKVIEKEASGLTYAMISKSLAITDMAMLSRPVCGIRKSTLIINLPGSPKGTIECFDFIKNTLEHAVALIKDDKKSVEKLHHKRKNITERHSDTSSTHNSTPSKVKLDQPACRNRTSPYPMLEVDNAYNILFKECMGTLDTEILPYNDSFNRVLAEDIYANEPIPPFPASIKDGYAVKSTDTDKVRVVRQVIAAGDQPSLYELKPGEAIRISTGAPIPPGADAVIQVEDTTIVEKSADGKIERFIELKKNPTAGQDIRTIGSDVAAGTLVLKQFDRLTPAHLGVLASLGATLVKVFKPPSIAVISTGNEVKDPGAELKPGQIRDANKTVLINTLKKYGYKSTDCGIVKDNPDMIKSCLEKALTDHDVIVTTGGVSMGEFDVIKEVLIKDFDAFVHFGRINMKPGKPTTFAALKYKGNVKYVFGLPGNPVSCNVTMILFVIPALRYMERDKNYKFPVRNVSLKQLANNDSRPEYHRTIVSVDSAGKIQAVSTGNQISSRLNSMVEANGLAIIPKMVNVAKDTIFFDVANTVVPYPTILFDDIKYCG